MKDSLAPAAPVPCVGIIDHGIAFAHAKFRWLGRPAQTRVLAFWDQDPGAAGRVAPWSGVPEFGYGAQLSALDIDAAIARHPNDEAALYRELQYEPARKRHSHGTHVLDLAAGCPDPLKPPREEADPSDRGASQAPIVVVQMPHQPVKDTSGASHGVHVLDALHYIAARAPAGRPVVINLSDGAYGGPHDGQSMLECGIDDFLRRHAHVHLVLAAGNAHEARLHASCPDAGLAAGEACSFDWQILPEDGADSLLEVWLDDRYAAGEVSLQLTPPGRASAVQVVLGDSWMLEPGPGAVAAAVISRIDAPNRWLRSMFLVAVGPTVRSLRERAAPHGLWRVTVTNETVAARPVRVDAWVERGDSALGDRPLKRQSILCADALVPGAVRGERTLGSLSGSAEAIVAGARYRRGVAFSGPRPAAMTAQARYSSRGPGRAAPAASTGPDFLAPGDEAPNAPGLTAAGSLSHSACRLGGTSMAAPIVTRRIVNLLCGDAPPAGREALRQALARGLDSEVPPRS
ncbi:MAG: S8 family serine peptidase [Burkholderiaceae bacterium]|nr:S8 family serine peptidase [Burkholderiaceae bacterium]